MTDEFEWTLAIAGADFDGVEGVATVCELGGASVSFLPPTSLVRGLLFACVEDKDGSFSWGFGRFLA